MEEVLSNHPDVAECAVIGIGDALKGQQPLGLVCLNNGVDRSEEEIAKECVALIRKEIGPVAAFKRCIVIDALPKTRSGKVLRGTMVAIADSKPWNLPATIDDPATLDAIAARIAGIGETLSENPDLQKEA
jgi:propionyl-CoA synthetase